MALVTMAVSAFAAWSVFYIIANRYQTSFHSSSWQESLIVAESGVDTAMAALNASTWTGWTPSDSSTFPKTYTGTFPAHSGDGNTKMYVSVTVDNSVTDGNGKVWYRIRSKGTAELPGLKRIGYEPSVLSSTGTKSHKNFLRKLSFSTDVTSGALHTPQVTRSVEALAQPLGAALFSRGLVVQNSIQMSGGSYTDSFDSTDPTKSTNGQYDQAKRQSHGDVASNSQGNISDIGSSYIYGNAYCNTGMLKNVKNVQGTVYNNFSTKVSSVSNPSFSASASTPSTVDLSGSNTQTITAGTSAAPVNVVLSKLNLSGSSYLTLAPPSPGQDSYINIWVTGDLTTSGGTYIKQLAGVHATIWVDGKIDLSGSSFDNENGYASYLALNGVTAANGSTNTLAISGSATFVGVVNAPSYALQQSGSGDFTGAMIVLSAQMSGSAGFHYDESLGKVGGGNGQGFKVGSWIEDIE